MATLGHGSSFIPKQETYSGRFWYIDDQSSAAHRFLVYNDKSSSYVPRIEEHQLGFIEQEFLSPTAVLGYGYLRLVDDTISLVDNPNAALVDFIVRENLRISFEHAYKARLMSRGATAQDVYSAIIRHRCSSIERRSSSARWRRTVWAAHTSLSFDDKYDHPLTTEPI